MLSDRQIDALATRRVFFGHQSVGNDIVDGIRDLVKADPRIRLNIVKSRDPETVSGPAFIESEIGQNGYPQTKTQEFEKILGKGMGVQGGIAMHKYCYVDFDSSTNLRQVFEQYRTRVDALKAKYRALTIIHITVPLTTVEPLLKASIKRLLGKTTARDINVKRNQFNNLLLKAYKGIEPIFDLAEVESTNSDGSRSNFERDHQKIYTLSSEYTTDGGHLNELGRKRAAARLLVVLSQLKPENFANAAPLGHQMEQEARHKQLQVVKSHSGGD
jgi:hypothetical protein